MQCTCGKKMRCIDSRPTAERYTRRRFLCSCGERQSSIEIPVDDTGPGSPLIGAIFNHDILKQIIGLCEQAIMTNNGRTP